MYQELERYRTVISENNYVSFSQDEVIHFKSFPLVKSVISYLMNVVLIRAEGF